MKADKRDFVSGVVLLLFSAFIIVEARKLPLMGAWQTSPGLFPTFVGTCLALFSTMLIAQSFRAKEQRPGLVIKREVAYRFLGIGGIFAAYVLLLPYIHFFWASAAFLFALMLFLKAGKPLTLAVISVLSAFIVQYAFTTFFRLVLP
ncbi:MAG: tripartite tricarboxylate transporter TctB family protein [Betaproteobacteria bacterium]